MLRLVDAWAASSVLSSDETRERWLVLPMAAALGLWLDWQSSLREVKLGMLWVLPMPPYLGWTMARR